MTNILRQTGFAMPEEVMRSLAGAVCRGMSVEVFFPGERATYMEYEPARRLCRSCPVQGTCLEWAIENREPLGMWGGLTPKERRQLVRERMYERAQHDDRDGTDRAG